MEKQYAKHVTVSYTPRELAYVLFKKKICPICGEKMKSEFETKYIGIGRIHTPSDYGYEAKMYEKIHYYHCSICDISYTISELIEWKD